MPGVQSAMDDKAGDNASTTAVCARCDDVAAVGTRTRSILWLPVVSLIRPRAAAALSLGAPWPAFLLSVALSLVGYAGLLVFLRLWESTLEEQWIMAPTFPPTSAPNAVNWMSGQPEIRGRTMAEVWRDWRGAPD